MIQPLHPNTAAIVKATIPALEAHGVDITKTMYAQLMRDPAIAAMFNQTDQANGRQPHALAAAVLAYARNIDHPEKLEAALSLIVERHVAVMVKPEQYPVVGAALLGAIKTVLGDAATPEILEAWGDAYRFLADVLISREAKVYDERAEVPGGWRGWRQFRVASRVKETDQVTSFWLKPVDNKPVMHHQAGQFLTFRLDRDGLNTRRSYSISSAPDDKAYRISVKRDPNGQVSSWFHDHLKVGDPIDVAPPAGDFTLPQDKAAPVILVSAGIGMTPFMSMMLDTAKTGNLSRLRLVHGDHTSASVPFMAELAELTKSDEPLVVDVFSSSNGAVPAPSPMKQHEGHVSTDWLADQIHPDTQVYICGPRTFQRDMILGLQNKGIPADHIHHELFGSDAGLSS